MVYNPAATAAGSTGWRGGEAPMSSGPTLQKKTFSYDEAAALLPKVRRLTVEAYLEVAALSEKVGSEAQARIDGVVTDWARGLIEMGIEVKGLWLVDFDNGSGYYCWRYPENGLHFFHSYDDGFRGRTRIQ